MYGLLMTSEDLCGLQDVFTDPNLDGTDRTQYVLQTLWRDMSANLDIVGPSIRPTSPNVQLWHLGPHAICSPEVGCLPQTSVEVSPWHQMATVHLQ